jgi:hypothetical protein
MKLNPINKAEASRYMGIKGEPDEQISAILDAEETAIRERLEPKYVYRETSVRFTEDGVFADGMNVPFTGYDIAEHLKECTGVVILAATLTSEGDKLIRQASVRGMAEMLAVDCLCSAAIEQVCDRAEEEIFSAQDIFRTWRFSPGYGDLPITLQPDILRYLNAQRRIGLTVTENNLLIPSKSVTAIIGISDRKIKKGKKGCAVCNMRESCAYRQKGSFCGGI